MKAWINDSYPHLEKGRLIYLRGCAFNDCNIITPVTGKFNFLQQEHIED